MRPRHGGMESDLPGEPTLNVTAYDGPMRINQPLVVEGEALFQTDSRGCLIQAGFAEVPACPWGTA